MRSSVLRSSVQKVPRCLSGPGLELDAAFPALDPIPALDPFPALDPIPALDPSPYI